MAQKINSKLLVGVTTFGSLLAAFFLTPSKYVWGTCGLIAATVGVGIVAQSRWVEAQPNQWLLVIRDGKLHKAAIGLKTMIGFSDTIVKFPSKVQKVQFTAENVTKEVQGVSIKGFVFWSVSHNIENQGPFRCYKYMEGGNGNQNVKAMCQSSLRSIISNSSLNDVLRNRSLLKDLMDKDLHKQLEGWGVQLQSVQITQVRISSNKLFQDLQAEYRQQVRLKAEQIQINSNEKINEAKQNSQIRSSSLNETNATSKQQTKNNQQLKRKKQQSGFDDAKNDLQIQKMQREKNLEIQRLRNELEKEQSRLNNNQKLKELQQQFSFQFVKKSIKVDEQHNQITLQKYQIDSLERIYTKLGVKEVKINQFIGDSKNSLAGILPSIGYGMGQLRASD